MRKLFDAMLLSGCIRPSASKGAGLKLFEVVDRQQQQQQLEINNNQDNDNDNDNTYDETVAVQMTIAEELAAETLHSPVYNNSKSSRHTSSRLVVPPKTPRKVSRHGGSEEMEQSHG